MKNLLQSDRSGFSSGSGYLGAVQHVVHANAAGTTLAAHRLALRQWWQSGSVEVKVSGGGGES